MQRQVDRFTDTASIVSIQGLQAVNSQFVVLSIGLPKFGDYDPKRANIDSVLKLMRDFKEYCADSLPGVAFVNDQKSLKKAIRKNKLAFAYALEGSYLLDGRIHYLDSLQEAGLIMLGMAHWYANGFFANEHTTGYSLGIAPISNQTRLSSKGEILVERLVEKGLFIDVSHMGDALFMQVDSLVRGRGKLIASHANAKAVFDCARNLSDEQMRRIAATGGLIGVCLHQPILDSPEADMQAVVRHLQHIASVVGVKQVCIGSDYEGNTIPPKGLEKVSNIHSLIPLLKSAGFSNRAIRRIMGGNVLRLFSLGLRRLG